MKVREFWDGIRLGNNHREAALNMNFEEQKCEKLYELYKKDHNEFFEEVLRKEESALWFLWLYSHMACEVYDKYNELGISEETSLQRKVKAYLLSGKSLGNGWAIVL